MTQWFHTLVFGAVVLILVIAGGNAVMEPGPFDILTLAGSVFLLLLLPVLLKLATRRPKKERRK